MIVSVLIFSIIILNQTTFGSLINSATGIEYLMYTENVFIESFDLYFLEQQQQLEHMKT